MLFIIMALDPKIWGPHYWFVLHTIALTYPMTPNDVTKKKYYDFIQNLPLFIPQSQIGNKFAEYLDKFPVSPYLDSRKSFMKWMHFIHNKINSHIGKYEVTMEQAMNDYYQKYIPKKYKKLKDQKKSQKIIFYIFFLFSLIIITILYNK